MGFQVLFEVSGSDEQKSELCGLAASATAATARGLRDVEAALEGTSGRLDFLEEHTGT